MITLWTLIKLVTCYLWGLEGVFFLWLHEFNRQKSIAINQSTIRLDISITWVQEHNSMLDNEVNTICLLALHSPHYNTALLEGVLHTGMIVEQLAINSTTLLNSSYRFCIIFPVLRIPRDCSSFQNHYYCVAACSPRTAILRRGRGVFICSSSQVK